MHALLAVIETAFEAKATLEQRDAGLKPSAPVTPRAEPGLMFMSQASLSLGTGFREDDVLDTLLLGVGFIGR